jgi:hypothetical protein
MIKYRPFEPEVDYPKLKSWWDRHNALGFPMVALPDGWVAYSAGVDMAMSFLYFHRNKIGVIELTTTNPQCAFSRDIVEAVKGLYEKLEAIAKDAGCLAVLSFVRPGSWEERAMVKMGYATSTPDPGHKTYAKPLINAENWPPSEGAALPCPSSQ